MRDLIINKWKKMIEDDNRYWTEFGETKGQCPDFTKMNDSKLLNKFFEAVRISAVERHI